MINNQMKVLTNENIVTHTEFMKKQEQESEAAMQKLLANNPL